MKATPLFLPGVEQDTSKGFYRTTFAADNPAHVGVRNANFDPHSLAVRILRHLYRIGFADKCSNDLFNCVFHCLEYSLQAAALQTKV